MEKNFKTNLKYGIKKQNKTWYSMSPWGLYEELAWMSSSLNACILS
jgi:hypothetical protein